MTAVEIKEAYAALPEREKVSLAAWVRAERLSRDPAFAAEMGRRQKALDRGRGMTLADVRSLSTSLARRGR